MAVKTSVSDPNIFYADPDPECFFNTVPDPECFSMRKLIQVKKKHFFNGNTKFILEICFSTRKVPMYFILQGTFLWLNF